MVNRGRGERGQPASLESPPSAKNLFSPSGSSFRHTGKDSNIAGVKIYISIINIYKHINNVCGICAVGDRFIIHLKSNEMPKSAEIDFSCPMWNGIRSGRSRENVLAEDENVPRPTRFPRRRQTKTLLSSEMHENLPGFCVPC